MQNGLAKQWLYRFIDIDIVNTQGLDEDFVKDRFMIMKCNSISTTYQKGIVATAGILNHCSYLGFGNRHQSDILFANKGTCTIKGDISINEMSDGINVINNGYRASGGDENLHALFFYLLNSLYRRCWNLVRLKGY